MASSNFTRRLLEARRNLFGFILSLVRDFELAEDIFQEVSVRILEREHHFEPGTNFDAWAREIARRTILEEHRKRGRILFSDKVVEMIASSFDATPEPEAFRYNALNRCVQKLDDNAKRLIDLRYKNGWSMAEIGKELHRTGGAVQVGLSRVRQWLAHCIQQQVAEGSEL